MPAAAPSDTKISTKSSGDSTGSSSNLSINLTVADLPLHVLVQTLGTKPANIVVWLRDTLQSDAHARVVIYSKVLPHARSQFKGMINKIRFNMGTAAISLLCLSEKATAPLYRF